MGTVPVTAVSPPGGRPRAEQAPANVFAAWLSQQTRTVRQLADDLGISRWTIYHLRNGYCQPSIEVAKRIAQESRPFDPVTGERGDPAVPVDSWPPGKPRTRKSKPTKRRQAKA